MVHVSQASVGCLQRISDWPPRGSGIWPALAPSPSRRASPKDDTTLRVNPGELVEPFARPGIFHLLKARGWQGAYEASNIRSRPDLSLMMSVDPFTCNRFFFLKSAKSLVTVSLEVPII